MITFTPDAAPHGSDGPLDHPELVRAVRHYRLDGTKIVTVERADGSYVDFHSRYVTALGPTCPCGGRTVSTGDTVTCTTCEVEYYEYDSNKLCPVAQWCDRCGPQAVCPDCVGD